MKEVLIKTLKKLRYLKNNVCKIIETSWYQPSYESRNMRFAALAGYGIFLIYQIATYTPAQSFVIDTENGFLNIPIVEIKYPFGFAEFSSVYSNKNGSVSCNERGAYANVDDPAGEEPPNPFYLANALDQFYAQADSTPSPNGNVSRMMITFTTIDPEKHIDVINMDGNDLCKTDDFTEASVPIMRGYINQVQSHRAHVQYYDCHHYSPASFFNIGKKNRHYMSNIFFYLDLMVKFTFLLQYNPIDFATQVITNEATYTLLAAISSFLGTFTAAVTVYSWLFGVGNLRPIKRRMKKLNLLEIDIMKDVDCKAPLTSSDSKPTTSEEFALLRRQVFFYLKVGGRRWNDGSDPDARPLTTPRFSSIGQKPLHTRRPHVDNLKQGERLAACLTRTGPTFTSVSPSSSSVLNRYRERTRPLHPNMPPPASIRIPDYSPALQAPEPVTGPALSAAVPVSNPQNAPETEGMVVGDSEAMARSYHPTPTSDSPSQPGVQLQDLEPYELEHWNMVIVTTEAELYALLHQGYTQVLAACYGDMARTYGDIGPPPFTFLRVGGVKSCPGRELLLDHVLSHVTRRKGREEVCTLIFLLESKRQGVLRRPPIGTDMTACYGEDASIPGLSPVRNALKQLLVYLHNAKNNFVRKDLNDTWSIFPYILTSAKTKFSSVSWRRALGYAWSLALSNLLDDNRLPPQPAGPHQPSRGKGYGYLGAGATRSAFRVTAGGVPAVVNIVDLFKVEDGGKVVYREIEAYTSLIDLQGVAIPRSLEGGNLSGAGIIAVEEITPGKAAGAKTCGLPAYRSGLLHAKGYIHGDLRLDNLLFAEDGRERRGVWIDLATAKRATAAEVEQKAAELESM
ncbi:hypothetical protein BDK51DRAFT_34722 [Blyttiomyces helicus]|uniref:Uncharacterized protein n=1 Tax=Blyttiomyces helicus TaxID=388810 RepID=A0A4P9WG13_9FUNG|nr:hypothetical protein BDK51DRAFT_34722 [Blyttiomyces helicus]|eukprot:RKO91729.1 hypothetical protein BDK51DRAFT_34722 [Blyttiomyces helicus]